MPYINTQDLNMYVLNTYLGTHIYFPSLLLKTEALRNLSPTNKWRVTWVTSFDLYLLDDFCMFAFSFKPCLHIITSDSKAHICR